MFNFLNKRSKIWTIIIVAIVLIGVIISSFFAIYYSANNYIMNEQYSSSNSIVIALDTSHTYDDPTIPEDISEQEVEVLTKKSVASLSNYLETQRVSTFNTIEYIGQDYTKREAYIKLQLPSEWKKEVTDQRAVIPGAKNVQIPVLNTYFNKINSNRISLVFDANRNRTFQATDSSIILNKGYLSTASISSFYANASVDIKITSDKNVVLKLPTSSSNTNITQSEMHEFLKNNYKSVDTGTTATTSSSIISLSPILMADEFSPATQIYILRDQETLINRMKYILQAYTAHYINTTNSDEYRESYKYLTDSEYQWASDILSTNKSYFSQNLFDGTLMNHAVMSTKDMLNFKILETNGNFTASNAILEQWYIDDFINSRNTYFHTLIEPKKYTFESLTNSIKIPNKPEDGENGNVAYDWMQDYVIGIIKKDNYTTYFPSKNPLEKNATADEENTGKWLVLNTATKNTYSAKQLEGYASGKYSLSFPIKLVNRGFGSNDGGIIETFKSYSNSQYNFNDHKKLSEYWTLLPSFSPGLFGILPSSILSALISYSVIILLLSVTLIYFYRIPGLFASLMLVLLNALAIFIFIFTSHLLSFSIFLCLFVSSLIFIFCVVYLLERVHKNVKFSNATADSSIKKAFYAGGWSVIDILIVTILISLSSIYFGPLALYEFGLLSLLFQILAIPIFILWAFLVFMFFHNSVFRSQKKLLSFNKKVSNISMSQAEHEIGDEHKYETCFSFKKTNNPNVSNFFSKKIQFILGIIAIIILAIAIASYILFSNIIEFNNLGINNALFSTFIMLLITLGFISAYAFVRLNWTTLCVIGLSNVFMICISLAILYLMPSVVFNETLCCVFASYIISNVLLIAFINNINNKWVKYQMFNYTELQHAINCEVYSSFYYLYAWAMSAIVLVSIIQIIFAPISIIMSLLVFMVLIICNSFFNYCCVKLILPRFIYWRLLYRATLVKREFFINTSLDKTDEQTIPGLNHYKLLKIEL